MSVTFTNTPVKQAQSENLLFYFYFLPPAISILYMSFGYYLQYTDVHVLVEKDGHEIFSIKILNYIQALPWLHVLGPKCYMGLS